MPESIDIDSESNVMFSINNTGKVMLYNVTASFEADSIASADSYVGNIKPGESGNVDVMLSGVAATQDDGTVKLIISYEDENGETSQIEKVFNLFVNEPVIEETMDESINPTDMPADFGSAFPSDKIWRIVRRGAIALVAAVVVVLKRRKKKRALEKEDDHEIS